MNTPGREDNFFHRLNPITTLTVTCCLICAVFLIPPVFAFVEAVFIMLLAAISGSLKPFIKKFIKPLFIFAVIFAVQCFLIPGGEVLWQFGFLKLYEQGLYRAIAITGKLVVISSAFIWFFEVTPIKHLMLALTKKGLPHASAYVVMSTFQMVPQLSKRAKIIMDAQRSRGMETEGNVLIRAKAFIPSLGPLIISALLNTEERALTLESRGFSMPVEKTSLIELNSSAADKIIPPAAIFLTAAAVVLRIVLWIASF